MNIIELHYNPKVTLDPDVHYVTPNWERFLECGPLTDARIFEYELEGRYGTERQQAALAIQASKVLEKNRTLEREKEKERQKKVLTNYMNSILAQVT